MICDPMDERHQEEDDDLDEFYSCSDGTHFPPKQLEPLNHELGAQKSLTRNALLYQCHDMMSQDPA